MVTGQQRTNKVAAASKEHPHLCDMRCRCSFGAAATLFGPETGSSYAAASAHSMRLIPFTS